MNIETGDVLADIAAERLRQDNKWGEQNHPDGTTSNHNSLAKANLARDWCKAAAAAGHLTWQDILDEEVCEAFAEGDPVKLRAELVQVAAVAVAWIESIDRRPAS